MDKKKLAVTIIFCLIIIGVWVGILQWGKWYAGYVESGAGRASETSSGNGSEYHTYWVLGKSPITCSYAIRESCGVTLRQCTNGNEYYCMTDLGAEDEGTVY